MIEDMLMSLWTGDAEVVSRLSWYTLDQTAASQTVPAVFRGMAPADHKGFPYMVFDFEELETAEPKPLRDIPLDIDLYDWEKGATSRARLDALALRLELLMDRRALQDADFNTVRMFLGSKGYIADDTTMVDGSKRLHMRFALRGFRQKITDALVAS